MCQHSKFSNFLIISASAKQVDDNWTLCFLKWNKMENSQKGKI